MEVHCHGGLAASAAIIESLEKAGCTSIPWKEWAAESGHDPIASAANVALAEALTERTASILLDQHTGALRTAIKEIDKLLAGNATDRRHAQSKILTLLSRAPRRVKVNQAVPSGPRRPAECWQKQPNKRVGGLSTVNRF